MTVYTRGDDLPLRAGTVRLAPELTGRRPHQNVADRQ